MSTLCPPSKIVFFFSSALPLGSLFNQKTIAMPKQFNKGFLRLFLLLFIPIVSFSQLEDETFYYGFHAGATYASINEIQTTLIRPIFPVETYKTSNNPIWGFTAGASIYYRFKKSKFAIQPEIAYTDLGGNFYYEDIEDLNYTISFRYNYLSIFPKVKYYLAGGLNITIAPQLNLIIDKSRLKYVSNQPDLGPDLQVQQSLQQVLKGNSIASFSVGIGYDLPLGLYTHFSYMLGISDSIETLANGFYFIENKNRVSAYKMTIGYHIPFFN